MENGLLERSLLKLDRDGQLGFMNINILILFIVFFFLFVQFSLNSMESVFFKIEIVRDDDHLRVFVEGVYSLQRSEGGKRWKGKELLVSRYTSRQRPARNNV